MTLTALVSCDPGRDPRKATHSSRVGDDPRDLKMRIPMAKPTGTKLVVLKDQIPNLYVDLHYATTGNVSGKRLYDPSMPAMLDAPTANKLAVAQAALLKQGYALKIWDAYRPPESHLQLWKLSGKSGYVADPRWGWSKHCSGRAIDVTLVDATSGLDLPMPSEFDDFSEAAASKYTGPDQEILHNVTALQTAMRAAGFRGIDMEWWHFENSDRFKENLPPIYADEAGVKVPMGRVKAER